MEPPWEGCPLYHPPTPVYCLCPVPTPHPIASSSGWSGRSLTLVPGPVSIPIRVNAFMVIQFTGHPCQRPPGGQTESTVGGFCGGSI